MKNQFNFLIVLFFLSTSVFAQSIDQQFFNDADAFFATQVKDGLVNYAGLKNNAQLTQLISRVENADVSAADAATKKAFYINAYNLLVIDAATKLYPTNSVQSQGGFFDTKKVTIGGEKLTLNNLEKNYLLNPYQDARLHFVLVCGALGCPPITDFAYQPDQLEQQLNQQTKIALNNPDFIKANGNQLQISQIFKWYTKDFGGAKNILSFINQYRSTRIPNTVKISYYEYDWSLNDRTGGSTGAVNSTNNSNNSSRYIVSSTIPQGSSEVKIFNNLYTQKTGSENNLTDRATFFTTSLSYLYGLNNRFNVGFATRYRRVRNSQLPASALKVFNGVEEGSARQGITAFGPQIRYAPIEQWTNFSIQSSFVFPIGTDLAGSSTQPYIDWTGATWNTQFFNDFAIGNSFSLFTELDILLEDIGKADQGHVNRFSTPVTTILSYNPNPKTILYALGGFSPYWQSEFDYFLQAGLGAKYQFTPNLELELLVTDFTNKFLKDTGGQASTFNIGFRFNL